MTEQKNLKRRVRARMEKTGERYTAARRQVVAEKPEPFVADPGMSDETLVEKTGKGWVEWVAILDAWGARERPHGEIAAHLMEQHGVPGWWAQTVTVGVRAGAWAARPGAAARRRLRGDGLEDRRSPARPACLGLRRRGRAGALVPGRAAAAATDDVRALGALRLGGRTHAGRRLLHGEGAGEDLGRRRHERLADAEEVEAMRALWREQLAELARVLSA